MNLLDFERLLRPLRTRVINMVARAVISLVDDAKKMQLVQIDVLDGETRADVERVQNYGFTSVPLKGAEAAVMFVGGRRDHGLVVAVDDRRYRLTGLQDGEVAIYTDQGDKIVIKRGGDIEVTAATKVKITAPLVEMTGNLNVSGTVTATTDVVGGGKSLKNHTHAAGTLVAPSGGGPVTGTSGGPL